MLPPNLFSPACALLLSCARLFVTPWTIACQPPQSMGFSRQENWMGCHFLLQGIFPTQGLKLHLLYWHADSLPLSHLGSPFSPATSPLCHSTPVVWASLLSPALASLFYPRDLSSCSFYSPYKLPLSSPLPHFLHVLIQELPFSGRPSLTILSKIVSPTLPAKLIFPFSAFILPQHFSYLPLSHSFVYYLSCTLEGKLHEDGEFLFFVYIVYCFIQCLEQYLETNKHSL